MARSALSMLDSTGKKVTIATSTILGLAPIPSHRRSSGAMAIFGAVWMKTMTGLIRLSSGGYRSKTNDTTTPSRAPITKPETISITVTGMWLMSPPRDSMNQNLSAICNGDGSRNAGTSKRTRPSCQTARKTTSDSANRIIRCSSCL